MGTSDGTGSLVIRTERGPSNVMITVDGEVDMASAERLTDAVDAALQGGATPIVLELSMVRFMDSTGLRVLLASQDAARAQGTSLRVGGLSPAMERLLEITGTIERLRAGQ